MEKTLKIKEPTNWEFMIAVGALVLSAALPLLYVWDSSNKWEKLIKDNLQQMSQRDKEFNTHIALINTQMTERDEKFNAEKAQRDEKFNAEKAERDKEFNLMQEKNLEFKKEIFTKLDEIKEAFIRVQSVPPSSS